MAPVICHLPGSSVVSAESYPSWFSLHQVPSSLVKRGRRVQEGVQRSKSWRLGIAEVDLKGIRRVSEQTEVLEVILKY